MTIKSYGFSITGSSGPTGPTGLDKAYDPILRRYTPATQKTVNQLPDHDKIRRERDSNGQLIISCGFGRYLQDIEQKIDEGMSNNYLSTVSLDMPDVVYEVMAEPTQDYRSIDDTKNQIRNSSFEIWSNHLTAPDWWITEASESSWAVEETGGVKGNRYMSLTIPLGSTADSTLKTYINHPNTPRYYREGHPILLNKHYPFRKGDQIAISFYYKVTGTVGSGDLSLLLEPYGRDTVLSPVYEAITNLSSGWTRAEILYTFTEDVLYLGVGVHSDISATTEVQIAVDQFQLEFGKKVTDWMPFFRDKAYYYDYLNMLPAPDAVSEYGTRAQIVPDPATMWKGIPTRVEFLEKGSDLDESPFGEYIAGYVKEIDFWRDTWTCEWTTDNQYIYKKGVSSEAADQYGKYQLGFYTPFGNYLVGSVSGYQGAASPVIKCLTYFQNYLWVIVEAYKHYPTGSIEGTKSMFLCVVDPTTWWAPGEPYYLETKAVLEIPSITGDLVNIEFRYSDGAHLYVTAKDGAVYNDYIFKLYRDYFVFDSVTKRGYFKEKYDEVMIEPASRSIKEQAEFVRKP